MNTKTETIKNTNRNLRENKDANAHGNTKREIERAKEDTKGETEKAQEGTKGGAEWSKETPKERIT